MSKEHWKKNGKLFPCPNPAHEFQFKRMLGQWRWAKDAWSIVEINGNLKTMYFDISKTESPEGMTIYGLILWKFSLIVGFV